MYISRLLGLAAASVGLVKAVELTGYEYVVVSSGAGGGRWLLDLHLPATRHC